MSNTFSDGVVLDAAQPTNYKNIELDNQYTIHDGTYIIPLAVDNPTDDTATSFVPFATVQVHAPYRVRKFSYSVRKQGTPPVLPAPTDQGAYKFIGGAVSIPAPAVQTDGSFVWAANVEYVFAEASISNTSSGFVLGSAIDGFYIQSIRAGNGVDSHDAPPNVTSSGVGPQVGWTLAKNIDITRPTWTYDEPSYWPAQLFSTSMVSGPISYPTVDFSTSFSPFLTETQLNLSDSAPITQI